MNADERRVGMTHTKTQKAQREARGWGLGAGVLEGRLTFYVLYLKTRATTRDRPYILSLRVLRGFHISRLTSHLVHLLLFADGARAVRVFARADYCQVSQCKACACTVFRFVRTLWRDGDGAAFYASKG